MKRNGRRLTGIAAAIGSIAAGWAAVLLLSAGTAPPAATGSIRGMVGVSGAITVTAPPAAATIDMSGDRYCSQANAGRQVLDRAVVADAQGRLANVVISIRNGAAAGAGGSASDEPVVLDQQNCEYTPRVVAMRVNQPIIIRNSDATLHNVHVHARSNREFNIGQPLKGSESRRTFSAAEVGIHVTCDIHGWMHGAIAVFDHPYHDVSSADGSFSIDALPPGTYVVDAWHETLGVQERSVTVEAGATAEVSFEFEG
jgi:plastocyanin